MSRMVFAFAVAAALSGAAAWAGPEDAPRAYCQRVVDDPVTRPIPPILAGGARRALNVRLSNPDMARTGVFRCMGGRTLVCVVGANLNCGKADLTPHLPAADQYCRENPGAAFIPMFVTGHDTAFNWRCRGSQAVAGAPTQPLDAEGFVTRVWAAVP